MWPFNLKKKIDPYISSLIKIPTRTKLPVLISFKGDPKNLKNKIRYSGGIIKHEYALTNTLSVSIPIMYINKISTLPEVKCISYDHKASLCTNSIAPALSLNVARTSNLTGRGVTIGIIDSGVFPHKGLTLKANTIKYFKDTLSEFNRPYDDFGHGTYMCGIISSNLDYPGGIAPDASLCVAKAFDKTGLGNLSNILIGIEDIYNNNPDVKVFLLPFEITGLDSLRVNPLYETIKHLYNRGIIFVAPSGNSGPTSYSINEPGIYEEVFTVGGCSLGSKGDFIISDFSSRGPTKKEYLKPDFLSISGGFLSLKADTLYTPSHRLLNGTVDETISMSGTSISAAIIAASCAILIEKYGELSPKDIRSILYLGSKSIGENRNTQGRGVFTFEKVIRDKK